MVIGCCRLTLTGPREHLGSAPRFSPPLEGQSGHVLAAAVQQAEAAPMHSLIYICWHPTAKSKSFAGTICFLSRGGTVAHPQWEAAAKLHGTGADARTGWELGLVTPPTTEHRVFTSQNSPGSARW